jgi:hypothetical protein
MGIFGIFGKKESGAQEGEAPYLIRTEFVPYKLKSNMKSSTTMSIKVRNLSKEPVMGSILIEVPKQLNFENNLFAKRKELRFGQLGPSEEKNAAVEIFSDVGTDKGEYTISVTAFVNYRDYSYVENAVKKTAIIEAV